METNLEWCPVDQLQIVCSEEFHDKQHWEQMRGQQRVKEPELPASIIIQISLLALSTQL